MKKPGLCKAIFYTLSFTWGLPLTLFGCLTALILRLKGVKPRKYLWVRYFSFGKTDWGGLEGGVFFFCDRTAGDYIKAHEFGHGLQNCIYGPLTPFIVTIPSALRYRKRSIDLKRGKIPRTDYYSIWFEAQASRLGLRFKDLIETTETIETTE